VNPLLRGRRGQAQTEYILVIGLVSVLIILALFGYRDAVNAFICKVTAFVSGEAGDCGGGGASTAPQALAAPAPDPPPPEPTPEPSPTPLVGEMSGEWCVRWGGDDVVYRDTFTLQPDGSYQTLHNGRINMTGPNQFVIERTGEGPFVRRADGSFFDRRQVSFQRCS
jgi:hypothetical protein